MPKSGPIIIIEDDIDDQEILKEVIEELHIPNIVLFFNSCVNAMDYLLTTLEKPLLILSDINLPSMTGMELKQQINQNDFALSGGDKIELRGLCDSRLIAAA